MLSDGHCYLRLFVVRYCRQIAQCLGAYSTFSHVEHQLCKHPAFRRHDQFFTVYISAPFVAHIAKSRKENPFYLGNLRRLNKGMPIRIGASSSGKVKEKDADGDTPMTDMAIIPYVDKDGKWAKAGPPI